MKFYRKKAIQPMFDWNPSVDMSKVSITDADKANGSPKLGDMVAVNPTNTDDMWLVTAEFLAANYEEVLRND